MKEINQLDLFSGIGGFHLGFERAGYKVNSYFSEVDKHAVAVYKHQFKDSTYVGSVTDVRGADLPRIDLITFGSPCQDFSLAGKRKGMEGERSSLILQAIRLIHECRPRVFIWENVKGTFSSNNGADFWAIVQAFANIGGYRLEWQLLNTSWFLPQNRERIYLVGYSTTPNGDWGGVFPIGESTEQDIIIQGHNQRANTITTRYTGNANGSFIGECQQSTQKVRITDKRGNERDADKAATLVAGYYKLPSDGDYIKVKSATKQGYEEANEGDSINLSQPNSETRRGRVGKGKAQTLETSCNQAVVEPKIIGYTRDAKGKVTDRHIKDTAGTIHTGSGGGGNTDQFVQLETNYNYKKVNETIEQNPNAFKQGEPKMMDLHNRSVKDESPCLVEPHHNNSALFNGYRIRRLTPIECERLQGFPDNHTSKGIYDGEIKEMSNTQRYKQCGNAVTVDVVQAIANKLHPLFEE
jgi:DNA (cytosine-5)-methyltransferase 1